MSILNEFRTFVLRGNVIDLAVGIVIGGAFTKLVGDVVSGIIEPSINLIIGKGNPESIYIGLQTFGSGILNFLLLAAVVFFVFVKPMNKLKEITEKKTADASTPPPPTTEKLLTEIRDLLKTDRSSSPPAL